jgi:hypothetical protein
LQAIAFYLQGVDVMARCIAFGLLSLISIGVTGASQAADRQIHSFERIQLTDTYYSEGANAGDINGDGKLDAVYGPHWYAGPDFRTAHEISPPKPQNTNAYSDTFFSWVYDFSGDGAPDVLTVGFPGKPAFVYKNPKGAAGHWPKHQVFDSVSNESPHFTNLVGDDQPELICTNAGRFGFATFDKSKPFEQWTFHVISEEKAPHPFGHGLGVGDLSGDGRLDLLTVNGWFEQPESDALSTSWAFHRQKFSNAYGGAEMHAYDVDGDGDSDVVTSLAAHDYGVAWYEQVMEEGKRNFKLRVIVGKSAEENPYGLVFTEPHSVALVDMDGDGLKDLVTGKTYWSHHKKSPLWDAGAVVYWFKLDWTPAGVNWIPYLADADAGIGRQISIDDVNGDTLPDIVVGGMKGAHVLIHKTKSVTEDEWKAAQPKRRQEEAVSSTHK